jgi:DNA-binding phage protein
VCWWSRSSAAGEAKAKLAREFGISRETVYQYLREQPKDAAPAMWSGAHADAE